MTLRVYKSEYQPSQIAYLYEAFEVIAESATILTISGSEKELEKVMSGMFSTEDEFKSIFPKFQTEADRMAYTDNLYNDTVRLIQTNLLQMIHHGVAGEKFIKLREAYNHLIGYKL